VVVANRQSGISLGRNQLSAKLADSKATVMQATPATWQLLLAAGWEAMMQLKILVVEKLYPEI
jgi:hypothetical protein